MKSSKERFAFLVIRDVEIQKEIVNLGEGVYAPLDGFLGQADFESVLERGRLQDGSLWPIPLAIDIDEAQKAHLEGLKQVQLITPRGEILGVLEAIEVYEYEPAAWAQQVFGTQDLRHPGVAQIFRKKPFLLGGKLIAGDFKPRLFAPHHRSPETTKAFFKKADWKTITGFQTRNIPHRGHEFLQQAALEKTDGLFIQPLIGQKKADDFSDPQIIKSYELLIQHYLPKDRTMLGILPMRMHYAGPREALLHALIRRNYGCTHFIVGRDHAGVGDFYRPYESQEFLRSFDQKDLGIQIMTFSEVGFCTRKQRPVFLSPQKPLPKTVRSFSGSQLRTHLAKNQKPPAHLIRPEVYDVLQKHRPKSSSNPPPYKSCVLWFTGLSQAGKTTLSQALEKILLQRHLPVQRLDGDILRASISRDLGFSKADRDEHLRRVGLLAQALESEKQIVLAAFISPYQAQRERLRNQMQRFIEIYVSTPLKTCEKHDQKGLYAKARAGEILDFTGVSAPYEVPKNSDLVINPFERGLGKALQTILTFLEKQGLITLPSCDKEFRPPPKASHPQSWEDHSDSSDGSEPPINQD